MLQWVDRTCLRMQCSNFLQLMRGVKGGEPPRQLQRQSAGAMVSAEHEAELTNMRAGHINAKGKRT